MAKFITIHPTNFVSGIYDSDVIAQSDIDAANANAPTDSDLIPISDNDFNMLHADQDGPMFFQYVGGALVKAPEQLNVVAEANLQEYKKQKKQELDNIAGEVRQRFVSYGVGQSETYITKANEANAYKAAGYPADTTEYPFVQAEANASNVTPTVAADTIITESLNWKMIGSQIEQYRRLGKINIGNAIDIAGVDVEFDAAAEQLLMVK